jgi:predicted nucleic acid-binding protein
LSYWRPVGAETVSSRRWNAFDAAAATATAMLLAERKRTGRTGGLRDSMIAGIVIASHAALATRNIGHFADLSIPVVDPWRA